MTDQTRGSNISARGRLRRFVGAAVSELDVTVAVVIAIGVAALSVAGVVDDSVAIIAVLLLLAVQSTILVRLRTDIADASTSRRELRAAINKLTSAQEQSSLVFDFDYPDLTGDIARASEIHVVAGWSLRTTVGAYLRQMEAAANRGARMRFACPNPDKTRLMRQKARIQNEAVSDVESDIRSNIGLAERLREAATGAVAIKVIEFVPNLGMVLFKMSGVEPPILYVKLLPYGNTTGHAVVLRLDGAKHAEVFAVLSTSLEAVFNSSEDWR